MKGISDATAALARIPAFDFSDALIEPLSGGLTNCSFMVRTGQAWFVLRLSDPDNVPVGVDRQRELRVQDAANQAGIAAAIIFANIDEGILLTEYIAGAQLHSEDLHRRVIIERIASLLRSVHGLPLVEPPLHLDVAANQYLDRISDVVLRKTAVRCVDIVAKTSTGAETVCCHNDLVAANIIASDRLTLLDWEYAANNDPYFDLALLIAHHDLPAQVADGLLDVYAGGASAENRERLDMQRRIYDAIQWLWLAARHENNPQSGTVDRLKVLQARVL